MADHTHTERVPGCFRCDLSQEETRETMGGHTLTTEVVKDAACFPRDRLGEPRAIDRDAFDAWLAERDAKIRREAKAAALRDAASNASEILRDSDSSLPSTYPVRAWLVDRADQIERGDHDRIPWFAEPYEDYADTIRPHHPCGDLCCAWPRFVWALTAPLIPLVEWLARVPTRRGNYDRT